MLQYRCPPGSVSRPADSDSGICPASSSAPIRPLGNPSNRIFEMILREKQVCLPEWLKLGYERATQKASCGRCLRTTSLVGPLGPGWIGANLFLFMVLGLPGFPGLLYYTPRTQPKLGSIRWKIRPIKWNNYPPPKKEDIWILSMCIYWTYHKYNSKPSSSSSVYIWNQVWIVTWDTVYEQNVPKNVGNWKMRVSTQYIPMVVSTHWKKKCSSNCGWFPQGSGWTWKPGSPRVNKEWLLGWYKQRTPHYQWAKFGFWTPWQKPFKLETTTLGVFNLQKLLICSDHFVRKIIDTPLKKLTGIPEMTPYLNRDTFEITLCLESMLDFRGVDEIVFHCSFAPIYSTLNAILSPRESRPLPKDWGFQSHPKRIGM